MPMKNNIIDILVSDDKWKTIEFEKIINETINICIKQFEFSSVEISINLCNNDTIQEINNNWRNANKPTNVLSFPMNDEFNFNNKHVMLGDIILAFEKIKQEAIEQNKDFIDHLRHLIIHSFLHLIGHDHMNSYDAEKMENIEINILKIFNIKDPYILDD